MKTLLAPALALAFIALTVLALPDPGASRVGLLPDQGAAAVLASMVRPGTPAEPGSVSRAVAAGGPESAQATSAGSARQLAASAPAPAAPGGTAWQRLRPALEQRFAAMGETQRAIDIAYVHFLCRHELAPEAVTDELLIEAHDGLAALHAARDEELRTVQRLDEDPDSIGEEELEEIEHLTLEVMRRYEDREAELGRRLAGRSS